MLADQRARTLDCSSARVHVSMPSCFKAHRLLSANYPVHSPPSEIPPTAFVRANQCLNWRERGETAFHHLKNSISSFPKNLHLSSFTYLKNINNRSLISIFYNLSTGANPTAGPSAVIPDCHLVCGSACSSASAHVCRLAQLPDIRTAISPIGLPSPPAPTRLPPDRTPARRITDLIAYLLTCMSVRGPICRTAKLPAHQQNTPHPRRPTRPSTDSSVCPSADPPVCPPTYPPAYPYTYRHSALQVLVKTGGGRFCPGFGPEGRPPSLAAIHLLTEQTSYLSEHPPTIQLVRLSASETTKSFERQSVRPSFRPSDYPFTSMFRHTPARQSPSSTGKQMQELVKGLKIDGECCHTRVNSVGGICPGREILSGNSIREFHPGPVGGEGDPIAC